MPTDVPWGSERPLDAARVERVVDAQFPRLAPSRAEFLAEGWDSEAYLVDGAWILRFPKRREVEAGQDVERALLPRLAPALPLPIPVPVLFGEPSEEFPFRFLGYRRIEGTSAEEFPPGGVDARRCAEDLAAFLSSLHAFPAAEARALGVPGYRDADPAVRRERLRALWPEVAPAVPTGLRARTERFLSDDRFPPGPVAPCLVHDDLLSDHVLLGPDGRVTGVIDWGDAALGDPAADFAGLFAWRGEAFASAVLDLYVGADDPCLLARARWRATWASLSIAWAGVRTSRPVDVAVGLRGLDLSLPA